MPVAAIAGIASAGLGLVGSAMGASAANKAADAQAEAAMSRSSSRRTPRSKDASTPIRGRLRVPRPCTCTWMSWAFRARRRLSCPI
jgi:hypothetical protein